ncbi:hypothetical protein [Legionella donaldsonii]
MLGRSPVYVLAAGQADVENLLTIFADEMRIARSYLHCAN